MINSEQALHNMLDRQIRTWQITDEQLLQLMLSVPRELFVPHAYKTLAYSDTTLPIVHGYTMMPPKEEARILQSVKLQAKDKVLILGAGGSYLAALAAKLADLVYYVDNIPETIHTLQATLARLNIQNVSLICDNPSEGYPQAAPFDVIVITDSLPYLLPSLPTSLTVNGRLFAILGNPPAMEATLITRLPSDQWQTEKLFETIRPRLANFKEPQQFKF